MAHKDLPRTLGLADSTAIVVGIVIGSGIFIVPGPIARDVPALGAMLGVWIGGGVLSLFGALAFAELGAMMPATGGQYVFLREAYGKFWAFLLGWGLLLVQRSGSTATLAAGFGIYLGYFFPLTPFAARLAAAAVILALTAVNYIGVRPAARVQNIFTAAKVGALALIIAGVFAARGPTMYEWKLLPPEMSIDRFGTALLACLWAYNGWYAVSFVAGEIKNPERSLPRSLFGGMIVSIILYVAAVLAYAKVLSISEIASTDRVAAVVLDRTFGSLGATILSLTVLVSIIGAINGGILTAPRVYFAMARDGLFFEKLAEVHPRYHTPAIAILVHGTWASALTLAGNYEKLLSFTMFVSWIFYGMTVAAVILLRRRQPDLPRPYRMWGYPLSPILFVLASAGLVASTLVSRPGPSLAGLALIASGIPAYYYWRSKLLRA